MLTVITLLKLNPSPSGHLHGERPFWREYGERYLDAWLAGVRRFVPDPKRIIVMTDETITLHVPPAVRGTVDIRVALLDPVIDAPGWWAKMNAFREDVSEGLSLYMDLDTTLTGDLSALCSLSPDPLVMLDDRNVPRLPNGSVMLFEAERMRGMWDAYAGMPRGMELHYVARDSDYSKAFDQACVAEWVRTETGRPVPFFQDQLPRDYCLNAYSELPHAEDWRDARLIFGCGGQAKQHLMKHPAFAEHWAGT